MCEGARSIYIYDDCGVVGQGMRLKSHCPVALRIFKVGAEADEQIG